MIVKDFIEKFSVRVGMSVDRQFIEKYQGEEILCCVATGANYVMDNDYHRSTYGYAPTAANQFVTAFVFKSARLYVGFINGNRAKLSEVIGVINNIQTYKNTDKIDEVARAATMQAL